MKLLGIGSTFELGGINYTVEAIHKVCLILKTRSALIDMSLSEFDNLYKKGEIINVKL